MKQTLTLAQKAMLGALAAASLWTGWSGVRAGWLDFQFMKPRAVIDSWRTGAPPNMKMWGKTLEELKQLQASNPQDPQIAESLGYIYALQAMRSREIPELKQTLLAEAIPHFRAATRLRPMSPYAWSNLALALHEMDTPTDEMWAAFDRAMLYGQREIAVQKQLAELAFARWDSVGEVRQAQMKQIAATVGDDYVESLLEIAQRNNVYGLFEDRLPKAESEPKTEGEPAEPAAATPPAANQ